MTSAGLGVDGENPSGALGLYESLGFEQSHALDRVAEVVLMGDADTLRLLGWDDRLAAAPCRRMRRASCRVGSSPRSAGVYSVASADGEHPASPSGRLRHDAELDPTAAWPAVGDWVAMEPLDAAARTARGRRDGSGEHRLVLRVLPRRTAVVRRAPGDRERPSQVLAANVDVVFIVTSVNAEFNVRRLERYMTVAWESGARPVVLLSKADLADDLEDMRIQAASAAPGVEVDRRLRGHRRRDRGRARPPRRRAAPSCSRLLRRWQVVDRQCARRRAAAGHRRHPRGRRPRPAHDHAPAARSPRGRPAHRHARAARARGAGRRRRCRPRSRTSRRSSWRAGSLIAATGPSRAAPSARRSPGRARGGSVRGVREARARGVPRRSSLVTRWPGARSAGSGAPISKSVEVHMRFKYGGDR